jgi:hypothetical protein
LKQAIGWSGKSQRPVADPNQGAVDDLNDLSGKLRRTVLAQAAARFVSLEPSGIAMVLARRDETLNLAKVSLYRNY